MHPSDHIDRAYAMDDEGSDEEVSSCRLFLPDESYLGGAESGDLLRATAEIVADVRDAGSQGMRLGGGRGRAEALPSQNVPPSLRNVARLSGKAPGLGTETG
jgi:hypothetical protein